VTWVIRVIHVITGNTCNTHNTRNTDNTRKCGVEQFAARHSYCINTLFFQKSAQDVSIFSFISIIYLISRVYAVRRPCSDFMDMLRRLISCRIIIINTGNTHNTGNTLNTEVIHVTQR